MEDKRAEQNAAKVRIQDVLGWFIFFASAAARLWKIDQIPTSGGSWREVEGFAMAQNFAEGHGTLWEPVVSWGGRAAAATELPLLPWLTSGLYRVFGESFWAGRSITVALGLVGLWAFWQVSKHLLGSRTGTLAMAVVALHPLVIYYGRAMMPDSIAWGMALLALWWMIEALELRSKWKWWACGAALVLAIAVKPVVVFLGAVFLGTLLWKRGRGAFRVPAVWMVGGAALGAVALVALHAHWIYAKTGNTFGLVHGHDKFQPELVLGVDWWKVMGPRLVHEVFFKWFMPLGALGLVRAFGKSKGERVGAVVLVWVGVSVLYLFGVAEGNLDMPHYQLPLVFPIALTVALGAEQLWRWGEGVQRLGARAVVVTLLLLGVSAGVFALKKPFEAPEGRWTDGKRIAEVLPEDAAVLVLGGHTHHRGGMDSDPRPFFFTGSYGWVLADAGYSMEGLASYCAKGARFLLLSQPDENLDREESREVREFLRKNEAVRRTPGYGLWRMPPCEDLPEPRRRWSALPGTEARPHNDGFLLEGF